MYDGPKTDRRLTEICRLFYQRGLTKSQIARRTGLSVTHINRLLREGEKAGVVKITVVPPSAHALEVDLAEAYGVRQVRVVASSVDEDTLRIDLAQAAAQVFEDSIFRGAKVGLGSGKTLFEMASSLPERAREIVVYPINLILEQDARITGATANAVATIVWFRSRPAAEGRRLEIFLPDTNTAALKRYAHQLSSLPAFTRMREEIADLDVYFLGASEMRRDSQLSRLANQVSGGSVSRRAVGDVAFNVLDASGNEVDLGLGNLTLGVPAATLRDLARRQDKRVILVAGGARKLPAIRAALAGNLCNLLITDSDVAEKLLEGRSRAEKDGRQALRKSVPNSPPC